MGNYLLGIVVAPVKKKLKKTRTLYNDNNNIAFLDVQATEMQQIFDVVYAGKAKLWQVLSPCLFIVVFVSPLPLYHLSPLSMMLLSMCGSRF